MVALPRVQPQGSPLTDLPNTFRDRGAVRMPFEIVQEHSLSKGTENSTCVICCILIFLFVCIISPNYVIKVDFV